MTDDISQCAKGKFLLAIPGLPDPNFAQTVTCMCEHNESGALGFIVNKIHPLLTGRELFEGLKIKCDKSVDKLEIYLGGPVQPSGVFAIDENTTKSVLINHLFDESIKLNTLKDEGDLLKLIDPNNDEEKEYVSQIIRKWRKESNNEK